MRNWLRFISFPLIAIACTSQSFAGNEDGSFGTRGGGFTLPTTVGRELVDTGDGTSCLFFEGKEVAHALGASWQELLLALGEVHPYFRDAIVREQGFLKTCFTETPLAPLEVAEALFDPGGLLSAATGKSAPTAVRIFSEDRVYIYVPHFLQLSPKGQALFWLHEVLHGFFDRSEPSWYQNLKNTVAAIDGYVKGQGNVSVKQLRYQLRVNQVLIPSEVVPFSERDLARLEGAFHLGNRDPEVPGQTGQLERMMAEASANEIRAATAAKLAPRDQKRIAVLRRLYVTEAFEAATSCDRWDLRFRLASGLSPNVRNVDFVGTDRESESLLLVAVKSECLDLVKDLLETPGIRPGQGRDAEGNNARQLAWESKQREAFRAIFKRSFRKWDW